MLQIEVPSKEYFDEVSNEFITIKGRKILLEHSLISLSKWESKYHKPFMNKDKTIEEFRYYIKCMSIDNNIDDVIYYNIDESLMIKVKDYMDDPMTATWFSSNDKTSPNSEVITSEIIYYWMISLNIPKECEKWHLNRLLTLIRVCSIKNAPKKKMSKQDIYAQQKALNDKRRAEAKSKG